MNFLANFGALEARDGEMKRAIAREEQERRNQDRFASTVVIAAAIIAAVRLARDNISTPALQLFPPSFPLPSSREIDSLPTRRA